MARNWPTKVWQIETEVFSKSMVNMADVILSPTQHLMDYVGHHPGFNITGKYFIIPPILSSSSASSFLSFATPLSFSPAPDTVQEETRNVTAQNEIVFYGIINLKILAPAIENFCLHFDPSSLPFRVTLISALDMKTEELVEVAEGDGGGTPRYPYPPSRPISLLKRYWATTPCKNSELHLLDLDER